jgi:hypothetical protein
MQDFTLDSPGHGAIQKVHNQRSEHELNSKLTFDSSNLGLLMGNSVVHKSMHHIPSAGQNDHIETITRIEELRGAGKELQLAPSTHHLDQKRNVPPAFERWHPSKCTQEINSFAPGCSTLPWVWKNTRPESNAHHTPQMTLLKTTQKNALLEDFNPQTHNPDPTIDFLTTFGSSSPLKSASIIHHENCSHKGQKGQARFKRTQMETSNYEIPSPMSNAHVDGEPPDYHNLYQGSIEKKARLVKPFPKSSTEIQDQHGALFDNSSLHGRPIQISKYYKVSNMKEVDPLNKRQDSKSIMNTTKLQGREENHCGVPPNSYANKHNTDSLLDIEPMMESIYFDDEILEVEHSIPVVQREMKKIFESIRTDSKGTIKLDIQIGPAIFFQTWGLNRGVCQGQKNGLKIHFKDSSRNAIQQSNRKLWSHQSEWFIFWEGVSGIKIVEEMKIKIDISNNVKKLLQLCIFYIDMIDTIIIQPPKNESVKEHKKELFRSALNLFETFAATSPEYIRFNKLSAKKSHDLIASFVWRFLEFWIKNYGSTDLKTLAFRDKENIYGGFKSFFNNVLKFSCNNLNLRIKKATSHHL